MVCRTDLMEPPSLVRPPSIRRSTRRTPSVRDARGGLAQLTLVEHAICPLDDTRSLVENLMHRTGFYFTDRNGHSTFANVTISAAHGLSAHDEYYLWGLLALTFAQPDPGIEFWATPHYCLRQLGCLGKSTNPQPGKGRLSKGGVNYAQFRASIKRLAAVFYQCDRFYDPLRGEHRDRGFGFLKYDLPIDSDSPRAWRIVWDPLFFEYCQATVGRFFFDLSMYRRLDCASRRLFLVLHKIFWRRDRSPAFDVRHLAVHVLGFSATIEMRDLKIKLVRCMEKLLSAGVLTLPGHTTTCKQLITKKAKGCYAVQFHRGSYFDKPSEANTSSLPLNLADSPLYDPLRTIGFTDSRIRGILRAYTPSRIQLWADITLAKLEHEGPEGFTNCPEAYFLDNLKEAASGKRTPPDWWRELVKREEQRRWEEDRRKRQAAVQTEENVLAWKRAKNEAFQRHIAESVGREKYIEVSQLLLDAFLKNHPRHLALEMATEHAERHFASGFAFPEFEEWLLKRAMSAQVTSPLERSIDAISAAEKARS